jgi:GNAT superfamily N-acetyltransferase
MTVRLATREDVPAILVMAEYFIGESSYGMAFDCEQSAHYLAMLLDHPKAVVLVSEDVSAGMIATIAHDWCKQPVCYVQKLFLMPKARGTGVARSLVAAAVEFARQHGCSHVFSSSTAGMGDIVGRLYSNLFRKFAFSECGAILVRSL